MSAQCILFIYIVLLCFSRALHLRNKHLSKYDFPELMKVNPSLSKLVFISEKSKDLTVNWGDHDSVYQFNKALLMQNYNVSGDYFLPPNYLIPPVPSRVDYVHHVADLVGASNDGHITMRGLDIGCGANLIYSILAVAEYPAMRMVGTEVCKSSLELAEKNSKASLHAQRISFRHQHSSSHIFLNIIQKDDFFQFTMCNPPFYASQKAATAASERKQKNLNLKDVRNFQGGNKELYCPGGELAFVRQMMRESFIFRKNLGWVTTLVSDKKNLDVLLDDMRGGCIVPFSEQPKMYEIIPIVTGNKKTRILAWKY